MSAIQRSSMWCLEIIVVRYLDLRCVKCNTAMLYCVVTCLRGRSDDNQRFLLPFSIPSGLASCWSQPFHRCRCCCKGGTAAASLAFSNITAMILCKQTYRQVTEAGFLSWRALVKIVVMMTNKAPGKSLYG